MDPNANPTLEETPNPDPSQTTGGTPEGSSPETETPSGEEQKPEPTAEELAETARGVVPETADAYLINLDDDAKASLGLTEDDPMVAKLRELAAEGKFTQGRVDDFLSTAAQMARAGLFDAGIDPAAEAAALGENAAGRRREVEVWAESLKERGEIDDGEFGELMSLSPTAKGVSLIEKIRKLAGVGGDIPKPSGSGVDDQADRIAKAKEMRGDARYETDRAFRAEADAAWKAAYPGAR